MRFVLNTVVALALVCALPAHACRFPHGFKSVKPETAWLEPRGPKPAAPKISVTLDRGYDDGDFASCSDAGVLKIRVHPTTATAGYFVKVEKGQLPFSLPGYYIAPVEEDGEVFLRFVWLDLPNKNLSAKLSIVEKNRQGMTSDPTVFEVQSRSGS